MADLKAAAKGLSKSDKAAADQKVKAVEAELKSLRSQVRRTMITVALKQPRVVRVQARGNWMDESGPIVQPTVPEFLGTTGAGDRRATRLDLANWFVDAENGAGLLTARVMVNRLWFLCFGSGLAPDLHDFGGQGQPPTHPELLDRLAHALVDSGWDIKATLKLIVTSRTYRQSSAMRPELQAIDPANRLYAVQSSFRLPAESVRDNALAISGLLVTDIGGVSVKPYQPAGYYRHLNFPTRTYQSDTNDGQWRRGVYVHWQRQFLHPMLKAFDAPSREECTAQRPRSNTPLAALALMNDPTFVEAAKAFAARSLAADVLNDAARIDWMFQQAVTRTPTAEERSVLQALLVESRSSFAGRAADATALLNVGLTKPAAQFAAPELAAWTEVCRAVLNLAETNTRD
ncbi:MAG: DUF1553 domain-containing protein [Planctomycetaceae bacterium]